MESPAAGKNSATLGHPGGDMDLDPTAGQDQPWGRWMRAPGGGAADALGTPASGQLWFRDLEERLPLEEGWSASGFGETENC